ncbi:MAG: ribonuclease J, partial [Candidatus Andersenbacteria bacterium]|nr:ribonuclease J [Candidatus Andersenbacteria bacterium]
MSNKTLAGNVLRSRLVQRNKPKKVAAESARTQTAPVATSSASSATISAASTPKRVPADKPADRPSRKPSPAKRGPSRGKPGGKGGKNKKMRPRPQGNLLPRAIQMSQVANVTGPTPPTKTLKVIPLGGMEEIGRNCMIIEYDRDIIIVDMGLQFPEEDMPGIDYIIPNISYLRGKEKFIRGIVITHGHLDHTGGLPHLYNKLGAPRIFTLPFTAAMLKKKQDDYPDLQLNIHELDADDEVKLGAFTLSFFRVNHNIPDSVGVAIDTPEGMVINTGDWKFDHTPVNEPTTEFGKIAALGNRGVKLLCSDSTSVMKSGYALSEKVIGENLDIAMSRATGRVIVGSFSSLIPRIQQVLDISAKYDRKVLIEGYSMKTNVEIAMKMGYLKADKRQFANAKEINRLPREKITVMCTGAQGEENAALMRIVNNEHRFLDLKTQDTVIFSSSVIPGNEASVQRLQDSLARSGVNIVHYKEMDIHTGGHATKEDTKMMLQLVRPEYYLPIHGTQYFRLLNARIAQEIGLVDEKKSLRPDNGQIVEFKDGVGKVTDRRIPADHVMVDGLGIGDVSNVV